jgi:cell wall assembly regulator SMI1
LSEEDLIRIEQHLGQSLPAEYRRSLLSHNGGRPEPHFFHIRGKNGNTDSDGWLSLFLGVNTGAYHSDLERTMHTFRERMPTNLIPIARDPGGNLICLSTTGTDAGAVYFWNHEEEASEGEPPTYDNVYFIANGFDEFLNSLFDLVL